MTAGLALALGSALGTNVASLFNRRGAVLVRAVRGRRPALAASAGRPSEKGWRELTNWTGSRRLATVGADPLGRRICRARVELAWHSRAASAGVIPPSPTGGCS